MSVLRTEADMLRTLAAGTYTLRALYEQAEAAGLADRPGGRILIQDGQPQFHRRVRSALQSLRRQGRARPGDDRAVWVLEGSAERPRRAVLVWLPGEPSQIELVLGAAVDLLAQADEPLDLLVCDPPYALGRGAATSAYRRVYGRDDRQVVGGYVEVDPGEYADFTATWVTAAAGALRPGGYLAVITGAQQAARVQVTAEDAGLTYVNSIAVARRFGLYTTRRFVHQHTTCTLLTHGALDSPLRTFHRPEEMPRGRTGEVYAVDVWTDIPEYRRPGLLRYDNALAPELVSRVIRATTDVGDLVGDVFVGSGTTPAECLRTRRRFYGGDVNADALRFTMARILAETIPAMCRPTQLALFDDRDVIAASR